MFYALEANVILVKQICSTLRNHENMILVI